MKARTLTRVRTVAVFLLGALFCASAFAGPAATPGDLVVEPQTLICMGFHWYLEGDGNENATVQVQFRKAGEEAWREGLPFYRTSHDDRQILAGSIFDLEPGTKYQVKLTMTDPDGVSGEAERTLHLSTRSEPEFPQAGKVYHIYPSGYGGAREKPTFENLHAALCTENGAEMLEPGDTLLLHAGEHVIEDSLVGKERRVQELAPVNYGEAGPLPEPERVIHVYPPRFRGEKEEPWAGSLRAAQRGRIKGSYRSRGVEPGTTILLHGGTYRKSPHNYRDPLG